MCRTRKWRIRTGTRTRSAPPKKRDPWHHIVLFLKKIKIDRQKICTCRVCSVYVLLTIIYPRKKRLTHAHRLPFTCPVLACSTSWTSLCRSRSSCRGSSSLCPTSPSLTVCRIAARRTISRNPLVLRLGTIANPGLTGDNPMLNPPPGRLRVEDELGESIGCKNEWRCLLDALR